VAGATSFSATLELRAVRDSEGGLKVKPIYMDHNATTPLDSKVLEAMMPYLTEHFGNASSSTHSYGRTAGQGVEDAREKVAALIGAKPREIIFTSGATESDNLAIKGVARAYADKGDHIITCKVEHKAVLNSCKRLEKEGFKVTYLPVDSYGMVDPGDVRKAITDRTILVSIMAANSEVGTVEPIEEIGAVTREMGVLFHTDATQAVAKIPVDVEKMNVDLLALSAHKVYGPKGVGAMYVRRGVKLEPLADGGGQERKLRSGTLNVAGIVGLGAACSVTPQEMQEEAERLTALRDFLAKGITDRVKHANVNGHPTKRLPGNLNMSFEFVEGESLILSLRDFAVSSGSACTSDSLESSYVLVAMGVEESVAHCSLRFGLGRCNTQEHVDKLVKDVEESVAKLRAMSPLYKG
jgi:cysteine desulfurase